MEEQTMLRAAYTSNFSAGLEQQFLGDFTGTDRSYVAANLNMIENFLCN